jgi:hypothetical protein
MLHACPSAAQAPTGESWKTPEALHETVTLSRVHTSKAARWPLHSAGAFA